MVAARLGKRSLVRLFVECKADPEAANNEGVTALHTSAKKGHAEVLRYLLLEHCKEHCKLKANLRTKNVRPCAIVAIPRPLVLL